MTHSMDIEFTFGVKTFGKLLIQASAKREIEIRELFDEEEDNFLTKMLNTNNILKLYIDNQYPFDQIKFNEYMAEIDAIGKSETQDIAMKISKYIWDYKNQGVTLYSLSSGTVPTELQLEKYITQKVQSIFFNLVSEFVDPEENVAAEIALQEICRLVVIAGYDFFSGNYNRSGEAINAAFTSGVGLVMRFRISDEYEELAVH